MRNEASSEYIRRHTVKHDEAKEQSALERLSVPIMPYNYEYESGHGDLNNGSFRVQFEYERPPEADFHTSNGTHLTSAELYELKDYQISRSDRQASLTLAEILPVGCRVYFAPYSDPNAWSSFIREDKVIVLNGSMATPELLLHLLHEAGHESTRPKVREFKFEDETHITRRTPGLTDLAKKMNSERLAWSYALKKIKPLLDPERTGNFGIVKEDVLNFARHFALESYSSSINQEWAHRSSMAHFAQDYEDDIWGDSLAKDLDPPEDSN